MFLTFFFFKKKNASDLIEKENDSPIDLYIMIKNCHRPLKKKKII